jgi:hypothetical protein
MRQRFEGPGAHRLAIHERAFHRLHAEHDVLLDRQVGSNRQLLIDHADATGAGVERISRPIDRPVKLHLAFIRRMGTGKHLHERALARAILADQRVDLARQDLQVDAPQRNRRTEGLADAPHDEAWRVRRHQLKVDG